MARSCLDLARSLVAQTGIAWETELTQAEKLLLARRVLRQHDQLLEQKRELEIARHRIQEIEDSAQLNAQTLERRIEHLAAQLKELGHG
jgi:hypothetical protein